MFEELSQKYNGALHTFKPFPKASDREAYEGLLPAAKNNAIKKAEEKLSFEFKGIPITTYMQYVRIGNRSNYEKLNFEKRYALNDLILGECVEHKGRFMDKILEGLYSICEETAWQLPAHNSYIRDTPALILPDATDHVVDLFAAETGAQIAMASYLLYDEFEEISPFINKMIKSKLKERIYNPITNRHFWWMGNGDEPMINWTVWCFQNVLLATFLNEDTDETLRKSVFEKACYGIDRFLDGYGDDGCCDEGAHYYRHSALCMYNCMEVLNGITDNFFNELFSNEKVKNIATYIFNINATDRYYFNYADCPARLDRAGAREFLFAKAINDENMLRFAASDYIAPDNDKNEGEWNLYLQIEELFTDSVIRSFGTGKPFVKRDMYYESVGVFITSDDTFNLSVKSGDNNDSHNHNDTGSVIVYRKGNPFLIDVGVETYTAKTFSANRYDIWTMQSAYHNLPTINGVMQHAGEEYRATDVDYFISDSVSDIKMDLSKAYPKEAKVSSYLRHVSLYKNKQLVIEDNINFSSPEAGNSSYFLSFMCKDKPVINGNSIAIADGKIDIIGDALSSYETIEITDARLKWAWKGDIYRIIVTPQTNKIMMIIS